MKPIRFKAALLLGAFILLSCTLSQSISPTQVPDVIQVVPTIQPTVEATVAIIEPTVDQTIYARAQIGSYLSIWLTYDPKIWNASQWLDGVNQYGEEVQQLKHTTLADCALHDNLGHGVPDTWTFENLTRDIGGSVFQLNLWTESTTGIPVLVVYQYPTGDISSTTKRIELEVVTPPFECIAAADDVIAHSIADITR